MISIKQAIGDEENWILRVAFNDPAIKPVFDQRKDRIIGTFANFIIYNDNKRVGFINLVDEGVPGYVFIDSGILKRYAGKGFGAKALAILLKRVSYWDKIFIIETKDNNESALSSIIQNGGILLDDSSTSCFYIMNYEDFLQKDNDFQMRIINYLDEKKESTR